MNYITSIGVAVQHINEGPYALFQKQNYSNYWRKWVQRLPPFSYTYEIWHESLWLCETQLTLCV